MRQQRWKTDDKNAESGGGDGIAGNSSSTVTWTGRRPEVDDDGAGEDGRPCQQQEPRGQRLDDKDEGQEQSSLKDRRTEEEEEGKELGSERKKRE